MNQYTPYPLNELTSNTPQEIFPTAHNPLIECGMKK